MGARWMGRDLCHFGYGTIIRGALGSDTVSLIASGWAVRLGIESGMGTPWVLRWKLGPNKTAMVDETVVGSPSPQPPKPCTPTLRTAQKHNRFDTSSSTQETLGCTRWRRSNLPGTRRRYDESQAPRILGHGIGCRGGIRTTTARREQQSVKGGPACWFSILWEFRCDLRCGPIQNRNRRVS